MIQFFKDRFVIFLFIFFFSAPAPLLAMGEYDGVWIGTVQVTIDGESETDISVTGIYQESNEALWFHNEELGAILLARAGNQWILSSPLSISYLGLPATLENVTATFSDSNNLNANITLILMDDTGTIFYTVTIFYNAQKSSAQVLTNSVAVSSLSGSEKSNMVFEIDIPERTANLNLNTWGGTGDVDVYLVYSQPDFDFFMSESSSNSEEISLTSPYAGKWYIILYGFENYSGVSLNASYDEIPVPVTGDWDGDGSDEPGLYYSSSRQFCFDLDNDNILETKISMGRTGDIPVTGDWDGNGIDDIGIFRPSERRFYLDTDRDGIHNISVTIGRDSDVPVVGDWDQDGRDDIGVFRPSARRYYMDFDEDGYHDRAVTIGRLSDHSLVGDWNGDGADSIGVFRPDSHRFYLDDDDDGIHDHAITFGRSTDLPVTGDWDGDGYTDVGLYRPASNTFYLDIDYDGVIDKTLFLSR